MIDFIKADNHKNVLNQLRGSLLITGGLGQIGSYLLDKLEDSNDKIVVVDNKSNNKVSKVPKNAELCVYDILEVSFDSIFETHKIKNIIHCAAQISAPYSYSFPLEDAKINVLGTLNIIEKALEYNVENLITLGSAAAIGNSMRLPTPVDVLTNPRSPYGISKKASEDYTIQMGLAHDKSFNVVRPFNVYSERMVDNDPYTGVIIKFISSCLQRKQIIIEGNGNQTRDFIHASNIADICLAVLDTNFKGQVINGATGMETSINEVVRIISKILKIKPKIVFTKSRNGDIMRSYGTKSQFLNESNFIDLETGLTDLIESLKSKLKPTNLLLS